MESDPISSSEPPPSKKPSNDVTEELQDTGLVTPELASMQKTSQMSQSEEVTKTKAIKKVKAKAVKGMLFFFLINVN